MEVGPMRLFRQAWLAVAVMMFAALCPLAARAIGPVDAKVGVFWWENKLSVDGESGLDDNSLTGNGGFAELWIANRLGFRAELLRSDVGDFGGGADTVETKHLDALLRIGSFSKNNYLSVGLGWQEADFGLGSAWGDTSGMRLTAEGSVSLIGILSAYGDYAWMPNLSDIDPASAAAGRLTDVKGNEWEAGLALHAGPFVQFRAGFHHSGFDMRREGVAQPHDLTTVDEGWLLGVALTF
jgi:hypothetical protein